MKKIKDLKPGDAIFCANLEQRKEIQRMLHDEGYTWPSNRSLIHEGYQDLCPCFLYIGFFKKVSVGSDPLTCSIPASEFFSFLPEKWAIKIDSQEVIDVVGKWLDGDSKFESQWRYKESGLYYFVFPGVRVSNLHHEIPIGYTRISLEEFKAAYPQEIKKGDWVYFSGNLWETVMQFDRIEDSDIHGINSYTKYTHGVGFMEEDLTPNSVRLATPEELSRIRDAYEGEVVKELRSHMKDVPFSSKASGWNEALELAISIIKNTKKI